MPRANARAVENMVDIRAAVKADAPLILALIRELAEYEKLAHEVRATQADLEHTLFGDAPKAEVLIAEVEGKPAGFCLFFHNYSTFLGKPGLYIEDIYVRPEYRGSGVGKALLARIARLAEERDCGRIEWWVLDWNKPAITFYEKIGAQAMDEWTVYRTTPDRFSQWS